MKYLFVMGGSGSGKTTLAKFLDKTYPDDFKRIVQVTTRPPRETEINNEDYEFVSDEVFETIKQEAIEKVEYQFLPTKYAARIKFLDLDKWNILVVCIEGFLSAMSNEHITSEDELVLLNITLSSGKGFTDRENRNPLAEEHINKSVLSNFLKDEELIINNKTCKYIELSLEDVNKIETDFENSILSDFK